MALPQPAGPISDLTDRSPLGLYPNAEVEVRLRPRTLSLISAVCLSAEILTNSSRLVSKNFELSARHLPANLYCFWTTLDTFLIIYLCNLAIGNPVTRSASQQLHSCSDAHWLLLAIKNLFQTLPQLQLHPHTTPPPLESFISL